VMERRAADLLLALGQFVVESLHRDGLRESGRRSIFRVVLTLRLQLAPDAMLRRALLHGLRAMRALFACGQFAPERLKLIHRPSRNQPADDTCRQALPDSAIAVRVVSSVVSLQFVAHHIMLF